MIDEMIARVQQLRRQSSEMQDKLNRIQTEMDDLNSKLRSALDVPGEEYASLSEEQFQAMLAGLNDPALLNVEVVYATRDKQLVNAIQVCRGATIEDAIRISGILEEFTEIDLDHADVGVFGTLRKPGDSVSEGDRIEIYRPLA